MSSFLVGVHEFKEFCDVSWYIFTENVYHEPSHSVKRSCRKVQKFCSSTFFMPKHSKNSQMWGFLSVNQRVQLNCEIQIISHHSSILRTLACVRSYSRRHGASCWSRNLTDRYKSVWGGGRLHHGLQKMVEIINMMLFSSQGKSVAWRSCRCLL